MSRSWKVLSARIDALSLRERAFLFLSAIALCVALADVLWISPAQTAHRQVMQKFTLQKDELQRLREELRSKAAEPDSMVAIRSELVQVKAGIVAADNDIATVMASSKGAMTLREAMVHFLSRHAGLTLVRTSNLSPDAATPGAAVGTRLATAASPSLVRRGLELVVTGPYPELVRYVQTLEKAMPQLRWGTLVLVAERQPPELNLQVFLVGPQP